MGSFRADEVDKIYKDFRKEILEGDSTEISEEIPEIILKSWKKFPEVSQKDLLK